MDPRAPLVIALGLGQVLAYGSTYYLPAVLAAPMAAELGLSVSTAFAAFSLALVVSALCGPRAGAWVDRHGGRPVLLASNVVLAGALAAMSQVHGPAGLFAAWALLGVGMSLGLYESAFAALVRLWGSDSRGGITGITLLGGLASTAAWPLSAWLLTRYGWRDACLAWAGLHLLLGLPLHASVPRARSAALAHPSVTDADVVPTTAPAPPGLGTTLALAGVFAIAWFNSTAMAAHLPQLLQASGVGLSTAVWIGGLIGPAQVAARLAEFGFLRHWHPLLSARLAAGLHPLGAALLLALGPVAAPMFGLLHGAGNGILTIAKGTLPLVLFGPAGYGQRQGLLMMPARVSQALAPWLFGLALEAWGPSALWLTGGCSLVALALLLRLRALGG
ncbi:MFS transporter [Ideonella sp. 4Y11]|uniref:MFS transporter n=2 Tax=Ideonella TaxID=36862 RepID=A0A940YM51_9BURK|nr:MULTISPECIES: MFS transporter [Ideonella]MBQ0933046.1 MFS transporter [Ideonella alba]MBQ0961142.1 MFS transporter [Ideonella aquatica]